MDFLEFVIEDLSKRGRIQQVAEATGLKAKTLRNIRYRVTKSPGYDTMEPLRAYYDIQRAVQNLEKMQQVAWHPSRKQMG